MLPSINKNTKIFYTLVFVWTFWSLMYIWHSTSHFGLAMHHMLSGHVWLVTAILDSAGQWNASLSSFSLSFVMLTLCVWNDLTRLWAFWEQGLIIHLGTWRLLQQATEKELSRCLALSELLVLGCEQARCVEITLRRWPGLCASGGTDAADH